MYMAVTMYRIRRVHPTVVVVAAAALVAASGTDWLLGLESRCAIPSRWPVGSVLMVMKLLLGLVPTFLSSL